MNRSEISSTIYNRLLAEKANLISQMRKSGNIQSFFIDNLLPIEMADSIAKSFPNKGLMVKKSTLREKKYVSAQMDKYPSLIEECLYAFQDQQVIDIIGDITGLRYLEGDPSLYAGGISLMDKDDFLNPHLDNSHNMDRSRWRVLNLLYYCSPGWSLDFGGNLELWHEGVKKGGATTIQSKFNRLVVMTTHNSSWHSVSPIIEDCTRKCISNYYFSINPVKITDQFHVTSFVGRPEKPLVNVFLKTDSFLRSVVRKVFKNGMVKTKHFYKK